MSDIEIHHLGAAYALDALDERERTAYEAHYSACELCRADVSEFRATAADLGALSASSPTSDVKSRVMAEIATTRQLSPLPNVVDLSTRRRVVRGVLSVAAVALAFVAGALVLRDDDGGGFGDSVAAMMDDPSMRIVQLAGDGDGAFTVVWTRDSAAVMGDRLPDPGPGKRYELWMIDTSGSHAMHMLDPAQRGAVRRVMEISGDPTGWGITIETAAGSESPTLPVLFLGEV